MPITIQIKFERKLSSIIQIFCTKIIIKVLNNTFDDENQNQQNPYD